MPLTDGVSENSRSADRSVTFPCDAAARRFREVRPSIVTSLVVNLALVAIPSHANAAPSTWGKIGSFGLGMLQDAVYEQHGFGSSGGRKFYSSYRDGGGRVDLLFKHGRVSEVGCSAPGSVAGGGCPSGFGLPDGVSLGVAAPYRSPWRGYARYVPPEPQYDLYYWKKVVRTPARLVYVYLVVERGKVISIGESTSPG
jgi:hypothetical protein